MYNNTNIRISLPPVFFRSIYCTFIKTLPLRKLTMPSPSVFRATPAGGKIPAGELFLHDYWRDHIRNTNL